MNKGRNIFLLMTFLLGVSILTFFTVFERNNNSGVVDGVRYYVRSRNDGITAVEFYFPDPGRKEEAEVVDRGDCVTVSIRGYGYEYSVDKETFEVTEELTGEDPGEGAYDTYSEKLLKTLVRGKEKFMKIWQAIIVGAVAVIGGLIILFSEEIWHIVRKKGPDEIPKWKDMTGIKWVGGGFLILALGLLILFVLI